MKKKNKNFSKKLNISESRTNIPYSFNEYMGRVLWNLISPLFRYSPRPFFSWRCFLLRLFGARIGRKVLIYLSTKIYLPWNLIIDDESSIGEWALIYNLGLVKIGKQSTISHRAHICAGTHNYENLSLPLLRHPIEIGSKVWICADAFIGPNIRIANGAVVAAGAVAVKNISANNIVGGNPAKLIKKRKIKYIK